MGQQSKEQAVSVLTEPPESVEVAFDSARTTSMMRAASAGDVGAARDQVDAGTDVNAIGTGGITPLLWALLTQDLVLFTTLTDLGADATVTLPDGITTAHVAAMTSDPSYLRTTLDAGVDVDLANRSTGETLLMAAMRSDRDATFALLIERNASVDQAEFDGTTPLHLAGLIKAPGRALDLLAAGADPTARDQHGQTFLTYMNIRPLDTGEETTDHYDEIEAWLTAHDIDIDQLTTQVTD